MEEYSGPSISPYITPGKATENFSRLCQLIMTLCSDLFRDILSHYIKPSSLRSELDNNRIKLENKMNQQQKNLIYPKTGNALLAAKDLDISVLYIILRNICEISDHDKGWGNDPLRSDTSLAACIERIRLQRNSVTGHSTNGAVEDTEFQNIWTELRDAIVDIENQLTGGEAYQRHVDALLTCDLNPQKAKIYQEEFIKLQYQLDIKKENIASIEQNLEDQISLKRERIEDLEKRVEQCRERKRKSTEFSKRKRIEDLEKRVKSLEDEQKRLKSMITESEQVTKKETMFDSPRPECITSARLMTSINVPGNGWIDHIANVKFGRVWVSDHDKSLMEVDFENVIQTVSDASCAFGKFDVTNEGYLLYIRVEPTGCSIQKITPAGKSTIMHTSDSKMIMCIHSSKLNMDLIIGVQNSSNNTIQLIRYDGTGEKNRDIVVDGHGEELYKHPIYITENMNGDIVVSDKYKKAVVVVDSTGRHRFNYSGYRYKLSSGGVCTDVYRHILVVDRDFNNSSIHVLDQDGHFLRVLLRTEECNVIQFLALCVDNKNNLYVGSDSKKNTVYKYLKD